MGGAAEFPSQNRLARWIKLNQFERPVTQTHVTGSNQEGDVDKWSISPAFQGGQFLTTPTPQAPSNAVGTKQETCQTTI